MCQVEERNRRVRTHQSCLCAVVCVCVEKAWETIWGAISWLGGSFIPAVVQVHNKKLKTHFVKLIKRE